MIGKMKHILRQLQIQYGKGRNGKGKYVFDGQVYAQRATGQYRYADEILKEFDKLILKDEYEIIVPAYVNLENKFKNLKVVYYGRVKGIMWTQISLGIYLWKHHAFSIGFCNTTPLIRPGIAVIHDIGYKVLRDHYKNLYGRLSSLWHRLNYWVIARGKKPIISVSEFSKNQISKVYKIDRKRITVIGNGWQHYQRITEDDSIQNQYRQLQAGGYYFSLGSLEERKNFKWVMEVARRTPDELFVIAGGKVKNVKDKIDFTSLPNVLFVGYITDGKAKWLMKNCKAFLFPSIFEGFGIPPLEAFSVGTKVICSETSCLPEICGEAAVYINPYQYEIDLSKLNTEDRYQYYEATLSKYSWEKSAISLKYFITMLQNSDKRG